MIDSAVKAPIILNQEHGTQIGTNIERVEQHFYAAGEGQPKPYIELATEDLEAESRDLPPGAVQLAAELEKNHLLVLEPRDLEDQAMARQVAFGLYQRLLQAGTQTKIREWSRRDGPLDLEGILKEPKEPGNKPSVQATKILLLTKGGPENFGFLGRLADRLSYHYAIITTEQGMDRWSIREDSEEARRFWRRPDWLSYFDRSYLGRVLSRELNFRFPEQQQVPSASIGPAAGPPAGKGRDPLGGVPAEVVVDKLRDPGRIKGFVCLLPPPPKPISSEEVLSLLEDAYGDRLQAGLWFRAREPREQLLALGLILFDGLPADQVFAGVETLVDQVWRPTDPSLAHFDYLDVERLDRYFKRVESGGDGRIAITHEQRLHMLREAWQLHRRRILASLPAIAEMVHNSSIFLESLDVDPDQVVGSRPQEPQAGRESSEQKDARRLRPDEADRKLLWRMSQGRSRELYGTVRRMIGLQEATVDSLSKIGGLSSAAFEAIEPCLRELAADDSEAVRAVVAGTLAKSIRWMNGPDNRNLLFVKLADWWREACQVVEGLSDSRRREMAAVRATVAMTVGRAAGVDPPNQMADDLVLLLKALVKDQFPAVRGAVRSRVLFPVIAKHLQQLEELVRGEIAEKDDLLEVAARGVAEAYLERPEETNQVLESWRALAYSGSLREAEVGRDVKKERLLCLMARSLGYMRTEDADSNFPRARIFRELSAILSASRSPAVRHHTLLAVGCQALSHYDEAAPLLVELLGEVTIEDRSLMIAVFTQAYLQQRRELAGGDKKIRIGDEWYTVWTKSERTVITSVEQALYFWLQEWEKPVAQQVAAETFAILAGTAVDRRERQLKAQPHDVPAVQPAIPLQPVAQPVLLRALGPLGWLALAAVTRGRQLRSALWAPFAELLWIRRQSQYAAGPSEGAGTGNDRSPRLCSMATVDEVFSRWRTAASNESLRAAVAYLERALLLYRWRWIAVGGFSLLIFIVKVVASHQ